MKVQQIFYGFVGTCLVSLMVMGFSHTLNAGQEATWKLSKEKDGIKIFTRRGETKLKDSKGQMVIHADMKKAVETLMNFDSHKRWMYKVRASRVLKKISDYEFYIYYEAEAPWPVSDRDIVSHYQIRKERNGKVVFDIKGEADFIPIKESFVRVPRVESAWELTPVENGNIQVIFYNSSDPGGGIPDWLANTTAEDNPYYTLSSFRELVQR